MAVTRALADPHRVRILLALRRHELCVCQITELFGLAPSTVSKHLSILHQAGLAESRKSERWVFYRFPAPSAASTVRNALDWMKKSVGKSAQARADAEKLKRVLKTDIAEICRRCR